MTKPKKDLPKSETEYTINEEEFRKSLKALMEVPAKGKKTKDKQSKKKKR